MIAAHPALCAARAPQVQLLPCLLEQLRRSGELMLRTERAASNTTLANLLILLVVEGAELLPEHLGQQQAAHRPAQLAWPQLVADQQRAAKVRQQLQRAAGLPLPLALRSGGQPAQGASLLPCLPWGALPAPRTAALEEHLMRLPIASQPPRPRGASPLCLQEGLTKALGKLALSSSRDSL